MLATLQMTPSMHKIAFTSQNDLTSTHIHIAISDIHKFNIKRLRLLIISKSHPEKRIESDILKRGDLMRVEINDFSCIDRSEKESFSEGRMNGRSFTPINLQEKFVPIKCIGWAGVAIWKVAFILLTLLIGSKSCDNDKKKDEPDKEK